MATDDNAELVFCRKACANYNAHGRGSPVSPSATSNWQSSVSIEDSPVIAAAAAAVSSCGSSSPESLLGVNWHRHHQRPSVDQSVCFQASLSSMVPLPPTPVAAAAAACENILFRELMGRLGTARPPGGGPLLPPPAASSWKLKPSLINSSSNLMTSGVDPSQAGLPLENTGTRLCPSPAHNLAHFSTDPGFAERAARFSSFSAKNLSDLGGPAFSFTDAGHSDTHLQPHAALSFRSAAAIAIDKIPRVHNSPSLNAAAAASCEQQAAAQQPHKEEEQEGSETDKKEAAKQRSRNASASTSPACTEDTNMKLKLQNESDDAELSSAHKESQSQSPCTDQTASPAMAALTLNEISANKRKVPSSTINQKDTPPASDDKVREAEYSHLQVKRSKMSSEAAAVASDKDEAKPKAEKSNAKQIKENFKAPEPPKDYIHVRARRGQATDSHSLAERVRREKISERMKFLQDLVPGCSKVTGKAVMLDEIINYVQSLQKQVEFLSMKLATVNPRLDVNMDGLIAKEMLHPHGHGASSRMLLHTDNTTAFPELPLSSQGSTDVQVSMSCATEGHGMHNSVEAALPNANAINVQMPCVDGFADPMSQVANIWDDDLHTVVQMGYNQNQQIPFTSQGYHGQLPTNHMKIEL